MGIKPALFIGLLIAALALTVTCSAQTPPTEPPQSIDGAYRLYKTQNIYTMIELDTRSGLLWQVQWNANEDKRFSVPIYPWGDEKKMPAISTFQSSSPCRSLAQNGHTCQPQSVVQPRIGRFMLYPTENVYNLVVS